VEEEAAYSRAAADARPLETRRANGLQKEEILVEVAEDCRQTVDDESSHDLGDSEGVESLDSEGLRRQRRGWEEVVVVRSRLVVSRGSDRGEGEELLHLLVLGNTKRGFGGGEEETVNRLGVGHDGLDVGRYVLQWFLREVDGGSDAGVQRGEMKGEVRAVDILGELEKGRRIQRILDELAEESLRSKRGLATPGIRSSSAELGAPAHADKKRLEPSSPTHLRRRYWEVPNELSRLYSRLGVEIACSEGKALPKCGDASESRLLRLPGSVKESRGIDVILGLLERDASRFSVVAGLLEVLLRSECITLCLEDWEANKVSSARLERLDSKGSNESSQSE